MTAGVDRPVRAGRARRWRADAGLPTLAYGEVRVGPAAVSIGIESLDVVSPSRRVLFERCVAAAAVDAEDVLVVRVTGSGIEVDFVDFDAVDWPVRTQCVAAEQLRRSA